MTNRDTAIQNARALAQQIFEDQYTLAQQRAYYVERSGQITTDEFVGNSHERQSVYFGEDGHATRIATYGLNGVGYGGAEGDYRDPRNLTAEEAEALAKLPVGRYGDTIYADEIERITGYNPGDTAYHLGGGWELLERAPCAWQARDIPNPSDEIVASIEAIDHGFFADE